MSSTMVFLFWIWCGVSVVILVSRPIRRRKNEPAAPISPMESLTPMDIATPMADTPLISAPIEAPTPMESPTPMKTPTPETPTPMGTDTVSTVQEPAPDIGNVASADGPATEPTRARSVATALSGIQMPCDLAPLMGIGGSIDPMHVVFATEGHLADEVGGRVSDELERIGSTLTQLDSTTLRAERGPDLVEVRIHPDAATVMEGAANRFPTAPSGSVVVEFRLR